MEGRWHILITQSPARRGAGRGMLILAYNVEGLLTCFTDKPADVLVGHVMPSFLSPSRNSSSVIILISPRLERSTSSSARYSDSFTNAFCRAVFSSSAFGSNNFPASHSRSFFFSDIPWIYVQRLFSCIVVIILTCLGFRGQRYEKAREMQRKSRFLFISERKYLRAELKDTKIN